MKLKDCKVMDIIVLENGTQLLVVDKRGKLDITTRWCADSPNNYKGEFIIQKVYREPQRNGISKFHLLFKGSTFGIAIKSWDCIYTKPDPVKEMTVSEISKELGYDVKIVK